MATSELFRALRLEEADAAPVRQVRSTLIMVSLQSLRSSQRFDRYMKEVPVEHRGAILAATSGEWIAIEAADAHYGTLERFGLSAREMVEIGEQAAVRLDGSSLGSAISVAKELGATPWTVLGACPKIFERTFVGGGIGVWKRGPKDAEVEVRGVPLVRYLYFREAWKGMFQAVLKRFSNRMFVHEMPEKRTLSRWAIRISWV